MIKPLKSAGFEGKRAVSWDEIEDLCENVTNQIKDSGEEFNAIIAISRGGLIPGVLFSHYLGIRELRVIYAVRNLQEFPPKFSEVELFIPPEVFDFVKCKKILVVDDIAGQGQTIERVCENLDGHCIQFKTAVLLKNERRYVSKREIDYFGALSKSFITFPWDVSPC